MEYDMKMILCIDCVSLKNIFIEHYVAYLDAEQAQIKAMHILLVLIDFCPV